MCRSAGLPLYYCPTGNEGSPIELSIITITYNDAPALERTLRSLAPLGGSGLDWELVVVDSSPETNQAILESGARSLPLQHLTQPPRGIYPAMNAGLAAARGEAIWFLNGGDELLEANALHAALDALKAAPSAMMALAAAELRRNGAFLYRQPPGNAFSSMIGINRVCHQAMLYRRALFTRIGPFSERYPLASDYEFHLRALHAGARWIQVPLPLVRYDMGGQSSQVEKVFADFAAIHRSLAQEGQLSHAKLHAAVRCFERGRIRAFHALSASALGPELQSVWRAWKRYRS